MAAFSNFSDWLEATYPDAQDQLAALTESASQKAQEIEQSVAEQQARDAQERGDNDVEIPKVDSLKRPVPDRYVHLERHGPDRRDGDISEPDLAERFGFRGIQYGNWVNQKERQYMLNGACDSFADMAEVLGVPERFIGLSGRLGLALGARGRGGNESAHYEPGEKLFNLTKTQGAGALAHEWSHALDHYLNDTLTRAAGSRYLSESVGDHVYDNQEVCIGIFSHDWGVEDDRVRRVVLDFLSDRESAAEDQKLREGIAEKLIDTTGLSASMAYFMGRVTRYRNQAEADAMRNELNQALHHKRINELERTLFSPKALETVAAKAVFQRTSRERSALRKGLDDRGIEDEDERTKAMSQLAAEQYERRGQDEATYRGIAALWRERMQPLVEKLGEPRGETFPFERRGNWVYSYDYYAEKVQSQAVTDLSEEEVDFLMSWVRGDKTGYKAYAKLFREAQKPAPGLSRGSTAFKACAIVLDGKKKVPYWSTQREMFARAFSTVIHMRLEQAGIRNDFASIHSAPGRYNNPLYIASPNPEGPEVDRAVEAAGPLLANIRDLADELCRQAAQTEVMPVGADQEELPRAAAISP